MKKSNVSQEWVEVSPTVNQHYPEISTRPVREKRKRIVRVEPEASTVAPVKSCQSSCSQSDWYEGGKCDREGCWVKSDPKPGTIPGELSDIEYWVALNVRPENQQPVFDLIAEMQAYYAMPEREKMLLGRLASKDEKFTVSNVKGIICSQNLIPEGYRLAFSHLLNKAAFDAQEGSTGKGKRRDNFKVLR